MTNAIEKAERDLANLEAQREALFSAAKSLSNRRDQIAFAALTAGDKQSKAKLSEINAEDISNAANLASVEAALQCARANLETAKAAEAVAADKAKAEQIAALNAQLKEQLNDADDALADAITSMLIARKLLMEMHTLGVTSPTDQMFRINSVAVIKTAIQLLPQPWINDFEFARLAPSQKKAFRPLATAWHDQIANQIATRLGEKKVEAA